MSREHLLQFQGGLGKRPVVKIIAECLSQHVPTPLSEIRVGRRKESTKQSRVLKSLTSTDFDAVILIDSEIDDEDLYVNNMHNRETL
jgi:hypothetical protein